MSNSKGQAPYRCHVEEKFGQIGDNTIDIFILLDEPVPLAVRNLTNYIKGIELQPASEVAGLRVVDVQLLGLLEEQARSVVDKGLVLHEGRHGKGAVDAAPKLHVEVIVRCAE
mgnify:CR=1 FL=1